MSTSERPSSALCPSPEYSFPSGAFLRAEWRNLILVNYAVAPERVEHLLPPGCDADQKDGSAFVSLVAFDFLNTRVLGVPWPGFVNFPEINLRSYIRTHDPVDNPRRGVVFIRELVPSRLVSKVARMLYNEPYYRAKMKSAITRENETLKVEHQFEFGGGAHSITATAQDAPSVPPTDTDEHFFKEHELGVGRTRSGERVEYRVAHPHWRTYPVISHAVSVDFEQVYGQKWGFLTDQTPASVVLSEGSDIAVYPPK